MPDKVLVVDDDEAILSFVGDSLSAAGYEVAVAPGGAEGIQAFYDFEPDIVVLDIMMPTVDGWAVAGNIREFSDVPILMLTALDEERYKLRGFELGVDDYMPKPFSTAEMMARIKAILARTRRPPPARCPSMIVRGDLVIDLQKRRIMRGARAIHLGPIEFDLLSALAEHPGEPQSVESLLERIWPEGYQDTLEVRRYIYLLRKKLEVDPANPRLIMTYHGQGYFFADG